MLCHSRQCIIVYSDNVAYNLETDNPYVPSDVFADGTAPLLNSRIDMPQDILDKARRFEKLRFPIRCITMIDIFIRMIFALNCFRKTPFFIYTSSSTTMSANIEEAI